ncbi:AbrB/MazE/SpoVT family DNA-binding domain-containing protein [Methanobrevibacter curvatus]|uniref:SpoVT-AbrB domain-containing protein n=1 Tax=Methanobrevibacter curvatus TaxID=49547 RepID=A0A166B269_9EURY|nr:AbrB/MazE/SpoVT family DNA-binding domain-containing protein [Methanobrevibacter curvatus]KZX12771.1 hypothetical protein MBCUR_09130 [Methanobrevibacter curvatus]
MRDIELKNKEVFIPAELGDDLNISENDDIGFKVIKDGIIIKFHEKRDSLRDMIGIVEALEPTNAVDLKRKGQRGEY